MLSFPLPGVMFLQRAVREHGWLLWHLLGPGAWECASRNGLEEVGAVLPSDGLPLCCTLGIQVGKEGWEEKLLAVAAPIRLRVTCFIYWFC